MTITVAEIENAARENADRIVEKFYPSEAEDAPLRDLFAAAYIAGANRVIKSLTRDDDVNDVLAGMSLGG